MEKIEDLKKNYSVRKRQEKKERHSRRRESISFHSQHREYFDIIIVVGKNNIRKIHSFIKSSKYSDFKTNE
jgi:hypothetical protein